MRTFTAGLVAITMATGGLLAVKHTYNGSINGTIVPADGATKVWALSTMDTLQSAIQSGSFEITNAKPGTYRVIVEAKPPYKNTAKDNVTVADGAPTNVGVIKLGQ